jgi:hypothetical protein
MLVLDLLHRLVPDAASSSSRGAMARPNATKCPCLPSRDGAGAVVRGQNRPPHPPVAAVTMPVPADEYNHRVDGKHPEEPVEKMEIHSVVVLCLVYGPSGSSLIHFHILSCDL